MARQVLRPARLGVRKPRTATGSQVRGSEVSEVARAGLEGREGHTKQFKSTGLTGEGQRGLQIVSDQTGDQSGHSCRALGSDDGAMD